MSDAEDEKRVPVEKHHDVIVDEPLLYSTTEGRQNLPSILQTIYGEKLVIGFGRYGRALGAAVPIEAVRILAGFGDKVDDDLRRRVQDHARSLLARLPRERAICGLELVAQPKLVKLQDVEARRAMAKDSRISKRRKAKHPVR